MKFANLGIFWDIFWGRLDYFNRFCKNLRNGSMVFLKRSPRMLTDVKNNLLSESFIEIDSMERL